jgi:hypothetical protein
VRVVEDDQHSFLFRYGLEQVEKGAQDFGEN